MDQIICHPYFDATDQLDWLKKKKKRKEKKKKLVELWKH